MAVDLQASVTITSPETLSYRKASVTRGDRGYITIKGDDGRVRTLSVRLPRRGERVRTISIDGVEFVAKSFKKRLRVDADWRKVDIQELERHLDLESLLINLGPLVKDVRNVMQQSSTLEVAREELGTIIERDISDSHKDTLRLLDDKLAQMQRIRGGRRQETAFNQFQNDINAACTREGSSVKRHADREYFSSRTSALASIGVRHIRAPFASGVYGSACRARLGDQSVVVKKMDGNGAETITAKMAKGEALGVYFKGDCRGTVRKAHALVAKSFEREYGARKYFVVKDPRELEG